MRRSKAMNTMVLDDKPHELSPVQSDLILYAIHTHEMDDPDVLKKIKELSKKKDGETDESVKERVRPIIDSMATAIMRKIADRPLTPPPPGGGSRKRRRSRRQKKSKKNKRGKRRRTRKNRR